MQASPVFTFANQTGLDMLETTLVALQDIMLDKTLDESGRKALCSEFPKIMQQVFAFSLWNFLPSYWKDHYLTWKLDFLIGLCSSTGGSVCVKHGEIGVLWAGNGVESTRRRWIKPLLSFHVRELVVRLKNKKTRSLHFSFGRKVIYVRY